VSDLPITSVCARNVTSRFVAIARLVWAYIALSQSHLKPLQICVRLDLHTGVGRRGSFSFEQAFGEMFYPTAAGQRNPG
jgi:hypothetical protein